MSHRCFWMLLLVAVPAIGTTACSRGEKPARKAMGNSAVQSTAGTRLCEEAEVRFDAKQKLYYMQVRGMTFPFRSDPCKQAASVWVDAAGQDPAAALGRALLRRGQRLVLAEDERDQGRARAALDEIELYLMQASANRPERVTLPGDARQQAQEIDNLGRSGATVVTARGPAAGAGKTRVLVKDYLVSVEGASYAEVVQAADRAVLELAAVFCGTRTCSDPVACSQGKSCGCRKRRRL